jgi:hypothetical protein
MQFMKTENGKVKFGILNCFSEDGAVLVSKTGISDGKRLSL